MYRPVFLGLFVSPNYELEKIDKFIKLIENPWTFCQWKFNLGLYVHAHYKK